MFRVQERKRGYCFPRFQSVVFFFPPRSRGRHMSLWVANFLCEGTDCLGAASFCKIPLPCGGGGANAGFRASPSRV